ncbi:MAG TPA: ribonuclease catalytic domain-containing protein [Burkholderiales bacterium]|nr:ribonuclease catalytic domain-containing protein [Burkholderiales bacterium]
MNVFFEEDGAFKAGTVLADNNTSLQVENQHGKRTKVKEAAVLIRFDHVALSQFIADAQRVSEEIDPAFLWECSGEAEFGFDQLGREYFGREPKPAESAGLLMRLHATPTHFYKKGKGRYKAAPADALKAALASIERKKKQAELQAGYAEQLARFEFPAELKSQLAQLLYRPDKNTIEYKALEQAAAQAHLGIPKLLEKCGAIASSSDYHLGRFLFEYFPRGTGFDASLAAAQPDDLPTSPVEAFSIDDATTTEIDDAFSAIRLDNGNWQVGVHIAAPALGIAMDSPLDREAAKRLSTVYFPGDKITMLPAPVIEQFTLAEERECPALSMYIEVTPDLEIAGMRNAVERVRIAANLRHDGLEPHFNEEKLASGRIDHRFGEQLVLLWKLATKLERQRGKEEGLQSRADYNFYVENDRVSIVERRRGSPVDKVVSEMMILVNAEWGKLLADNGIPGLYRAQAAGKVKMSTVPAPHQGLGVAQYVWASSPLRRYADLVNQRQLLSLVRNDPPAYPPRDERLLVILRDFELAYDAYGEFQRGMERYWCLRWLIQEGVTVTGAEVLRDELVRLDRIPFVTRIPSMPALPSGSRVEVALSDIDLLDVTMHCEFVRSLEASPA